MFSFFEVAQNRITILKKKNISEFKIFFLVGIGGNVTWLQKTLGHSFIII